MLYVLKEQDYDVFIFYRSDDTATEVLEWLAERNPRNMIHLMTVDDTDNTLYQDLKLNYEHFNIRDDWYNVLNTHGWHALFDKLRLKATYVNAKPINEFFKD